MAESLDIGTIINKKALAASHIYQMMLDADVNNTRFIMSINTDVAEFVAQPGSKITRKKVFELGLPKGATIGGLVRKGVVMLVNGNSRIEPGDSVMVFCHEQKLNNVEKFFKKSTIW
jgi:trk system potassium uptake protein TrkA